MDIQEKERLAVSLSKKLGICLKGVQISALVLLLFGMALIIFVIAGMVTGLRTDNPAGFIAGVAVTGGGAILGGASSVTVMIISQILLKKLKALGRTDGSGPKGE